MASGFHDFILLRLFVVFTLALSLADPATTTSYITTDSNFTAVDNFIADAYRTPTSNVTAETDEKATFLCTYSGAYISKVVLIEKNTDSFSALQAQIASFFPHQSAKFSISYTVAENYLVVGELEWVEIATDEDVRNLMAYYERLSRASSNPVGIRLQVIPPEVDISWIVWLVFGLSIAVPVLVIVINCCCD